jgi:3'-phosphoadenosine 5'-phosphosulfate sulfotransferase (PAPS reductase)/FAD synthetase
MKPVERTTDLDALLRSAAPVALGISGGKDSTAMVLATLDYLDSIGHSGPRLLIHSDLGRVEWRQSQPMCQRLAEYTGLELVIVRRQAGDMLARWQQRWQNNVARYANLECVKLILPWSTPSMRFCTSELKTAVICRYLVKRFPGETILNAVGIRREESYGRAKAVVVKPQNKLTSKTHQTRGYDWNPILDYTVEDVWDCHDEHRFPRHEAYTGYGSTRVSCVFCIMASRGDLNAGVSCSDNHQLYRAMVQLERASTFHFQSGLWLGDIAPHLLDTPTRSALAEAKERAALREAAEQRIPRHLLSTKGWPTCMPTPQEARVLAEVRRDVAAAVGLDISYDDAESIRHRYTDLLAKKGNSKSSSATLVQEMLW